MYGCWCWCWWCGGLACYPLQAAAPQRHQDCTAPTWASILMYVLALLTYTYTHLHALTTPMPPTWLYQTAERRSKRNTPPPPGLSLPIAVATPGGCATPFRSPWSAAARALELTLASSPPSPFAVANSPACACACSPHRSSNCRPCFSHVGRQQEPLPKPLRFPPSSRLSYTGMLHLRIPHLHVHAPTCTHTRQDSLDAGTGYTAYMSTSTPLSYARTDVCCIHASILYTQAPPHGPGAAGCPA